MKSFRLITVLVLAAAVMVPISASAQVITGTIIGAVTDESGAVLPGATVTITSPALPAGPANQVTNEKGQYRFPNLAPGVYALDITLAGFAQYKEEGLRISVGATTERNVAMKLSSVSETITVTGESPIVDTKKSGVSANFSEEVVSNTPVRRFSQFDFFKWAPGVSATSPTSATSSSMTAFGSSINDNAYRIDGTDFTAPVSGGAWPYPDTDVIEEIEVVTLGASAEYGNVQGAVFNVVSKQGGNDFKFDFSYFAQPEWLTSSPINLDCGGCSAGPETGFTRTKYRDLTTHAGGPIVKDKLWFFGGYQYQRDYDSQPGTDPDFPRQWEADRMFWKINWQITDKLRFMHNYHDDIWVIPAVPDLANPFETVTSYHGHNPTYTIADLTGVVSPDTYWEARVSGFIAPADHADANNPDLTQAWHQDLSTGVASGGSYLHGAFTQNRLDVIGKLSHYASDWIGSDHDFKFGVQFVHGYSRQFYLYPGGAHLYDYAGAPYYSYSRDPFVYGGQSRSLGVFAEDVVRPNDRLTLSLGVRFDSNKAISPDLPAYDNLGNETDGTVRGLGDLFTWNTVSPRLGFNFKLTDDGRTILRGNYGRFNQMIVTGELHFLHPGQSPATYAYFDPATGSYSDVVSVTDFTADLRVNPDTKSPITDQFSIGFDREIGRDMGLGMTYAYKKGKNYTGFVDTVGQYGTDSFTLDNGQTIETHPLLTDPSERIYEFTNPSGFFTKYNGFLVFFNKRWSDRWQAVVSYNVSKAEGLITSNGRPPSSAQTSALTSLSVARFGRDPNDLTNATGRLLNDRTHMFRVQTAYEIPRVDVMVGAAIQYVTGKPYAPQANVGLPQGTRQIYMEPLGTYRLQPQTLLDLRISKIFQFKGDRRIEVLADIMNLLQEEAEESIVTRNFFSGDFGSPSTWIDPRRAMIGVKFYF